MATMLYSVNPDTISVECGIYGTYDINGAGTSGIPVGTLIADRVSLIDHGDDKFDRHMDSAESIAKDIQTRYPDAGFFTSERAIPTDREVGEATARFRAACIEHVRHADSLWERTHSRELIDEKARRAARYLGVTPAWMDPVTKETGDTKECPRCFETIKAQANLCKHCGTDLQAYVPMPPPTATALPPAGKAGKL